MSRRASEPESGFTLIEAVVALALVAVVLAAVGSLIGTIARGTQTLEQRVALNETARLIAATLQVDRLHRTDESSGETMGHRWELRTVPFADSPDVPNSPWMPVQVMLRVQSPSGAIVSIDSIRLQKKVQRN